MKKKKTQWEPTDDSSNIHHNLLHNMPKSVAVLYINYCFSKHPPELKEIATCGHLKTNERLKETGIKRCVK
jgi:hypothetical protein